MPDLEQEALAAPSEGEEEPAVSAEGLEAMELANLEQ